MCDSSVLIPNKMGVTSDCLYNLKTSAGRSRSYRASLAPVNKSSFNSGDTMIFYLPGGRRNTYLDPTQSYLRMTVANTDAAIATYFDTTAYSVINRLDIFHASNLLETIQQYNVLANYITDVHLDATSRYGLSTLYGTEGATNPRQGATIAAEGQLTVALPLLSSVCGVGADKCLPLGMLHDDVRLEFTIASQIEGMVAATTAWAGPWTIVSAEIELCIIELSDEMEDMVRSVTPPERPIYISGNSWRHYVSTLPASAGSFSFLVPARFASLRQLAVLPRRSTETVLQTAYSVGSRINPNIAQLWFRIGGAILPAKVINLINSSNTGGFAEGFAELLKAWHALDSTGMPTIMSSAYYNVSDVATSATTGVTKASTAANSYKNAFALAIELESFAQRSDVMLSGMNTLANQVFLEGSISTAPEVAYTLDSFASYDCIYVIEDGIISVRF